MSSIKNLNMAETLLNNDNIEVKKSFFGLFSSASYKPTGSRLRVFQAEYTPEEGAKMERILLRPVQEWEIAMNDSHPKTTPMGNMVLEGCVSEDGRFAILHLLRFQDFLYAEVVKPIVLEGSEAAMASRLL